MASEYINKGQESIQRTLWPEFQPMAQSNEKNSRQKNLAYDIHQKQHQTNTSSPIEDEREDVFSPSIIQTIDEMRPVDGFRNQDYIDWGRTDEERREAFLADLYEGPYVNIGRPILVPVSRLSRTKLRGTSARIFHDSPVDLPFPRGFRRESPDAFLGPAAPINATAPPTPTRLGSLSVGEARRSNKTIRLEKNENTGMNSDPNKPSPGTGNHLIFDPSPKNLLALGMKGKTINGAQSGSTMDINKIQGETAPSTPPHPPPGFQQEEGPYGATPDRPRTVKTTPATMFPCNDTKPDESPTLRLQMGRLRITSADDFNSGAAAGSGSSDRYSGRAHSPHPYYFGYPVPRTPTKTKRARGEFERTTTLSGRDVAREREILARFAAAAKDEDGDEEDEKEEGEEDEELTPKASVLNRHMDIDEE
ncbi:hypothetical protein CGRA01v4_12042 [Colletotrichum graminicola]|uniref:Uncharacterized protein n=1 Tax=Colletotrichum graminicola (strain M1.001 / M2 / FGSC 10212) TaxID=645133 RepID=E3QBQ0_COLGM|nr:uncharacterized protein GLRG_03533 [Colletotrichum graminicola M1.001]EFQ28389.1 hypothetical protein GLRG_03533 [Colletotrichum graminicola M1.001]WDK20754.1 hypothetical protein CGRA01v4_12042 [Colletotrichum graminicola]